VYTVNRHRNGTLNDNFCQTFLLNIPQIRRNVKQKSMTIFGIDFCFWPKLRSSQSHHDSTALFQKLHLASLLIAPSLRTIQFLFFKFLPLNNRFLHFYIFTCFLSLSLSLSIGLQQQIQDVRKTQFSSLSLLLSLNMVCWPGRIDS
jgi:hypothetical protein